MKNNEAFLLAKALSDTIKQHFWKAMPKTVWHYTSIDAFVGMCESSEFWLSDHRAVNDKSEIVASKVCINKLLSSMTERISTQPEKDPSTEGYASLISNNSPVYIGSFSMAKDLLSQWKGYAGSSTGISVAFDMSKLKEYAKTQNFLISRVLYDEAKMEVILNHFTDQILSASQSWSGSINIETPESRSFFAIFIELLETGFKGSKWKEEREVRIIAPWQIDSPKFRILNKRLTSYMPLSIEPIYCIKEVILLDKDLYQAQVLREYLNSKDLKHVRISHSSLSIRV